MDGGDSPSTVQSRKSKEVEDASPLGGGGKNKLEPCLRNEMEGAI